MAPKLRFKQSAAKTKKSQKENPQETHNPPPTKKARTSSIPPSRAYPSISRTYKDLDMKIRSDDLKTVPQLIGRRINWDSFPDDAMKNQLLATFRRMQWVQMSTFESTSVSPLCVRDFYAGIYDHQQDMEEPDLWDENSLNLFFNGSDRTITSRDWGEMFGTNYDVGEKYRSGTSAEHQYWQDLTGTVYSEKNRSVEKFPDAHDRLLLLFIARTMVCRKQSFSIVLPDDLWIKKKAKITSPLLPHERLDTSGFMLQKMKRASTKKGKRSLPYANLITHFCKTHKDEGWWNTTYERDLKKISAPPISKHNLIKSGFEYVDKTWTKKGPEGENVPLPPDQTPPIPSQGTQASSSSTPPSTTPMPERIFRQVVSLYDTVDEIRLEVSTLTDNVKTRLRTIKARADRRGRRIREMHAMLAGIYRHLGLGEPPEVEDSDIEDLDSEDDGLGNDEDDEDDEDEVDAAAAVSAKEGKGKKKLDESDKDESD